MQPINKKVASRRFVLTMTIVVISTLLLSGGLMSSDDFKNIIIWISGIYIIGKPAGDAIAVTLQASTLKTAENIRLLSESKR